MSAVLNMLDTVTVSDQVTETLSIVNGVNTPVQNTVQPQYQFQNGTSSTGTIALQNDLHWEKTGVNAVTLASAGTVTYTLSALTDVAGRSIDFARVTKLLITLTTVTAGDYLSVGNATTHPWTGIISSGTATIPVYSTLLMVSAQPTGFVVASGSSDQLLITNSGSHSITFNIAIAGCST